MTLPPAAGATPQVHGLFDPATWTVSCVVHAGAGTDCAIIDPVLDDDPKSGRTGHASADKVIDHVRSHGLTVRWILQTHAHADHLWAALFMPDVGTARCDFPGGDARTLYASTRKLLSQPPQTRLFMCHDHPPRHREVAFQTTVAAQRAGNIHVHDGIGEAEFVALRTGRDPTLELPTLMLPSVQVNIRAGRMPPTEDNGVAYLKIPLDTL
jgi:glyoxylase-like metal-dependent hydrolase (beta-lactamase superfamily II)